MDTKSVGMIGLGLMGTALTERLLAAGHAVRVYNRTRAKAEPLIALGAHWSDNPLQVCDRVLISLYTTDTVGEILDRLADGLRPGQILRLLIHRNYTITALSRHMRRRIVLPPARPRADVRSAGPAARAS